MKKTTANEWRQNPAPVFRAADKGERVEISHDHYKDRRFVLTAEDKDAPRVKKGDE